MRKLLKTTTMIAMSIVLGTSMAAMAAKAKPKPKPKPKPVVKTTNHATLGAKQMTGEYAEIGSTYTLGKDSPWNVTLKSAEYSINPVVIGEVVYYPKAGEKLLVLHLNLHNPQQQEAFARYDTFSITAVDAKNENHEFINDAGVENTKSSFSMTMKPSQKVDVYTAVAVPAAGEVPKLIIKSSDDLVLRYDLKGKLKPLPAPYADPKDATGASALSTIKGDMGAFYSLGEFSFKLEGASYSEKPVKDYDLEEGNRYVVLNAVIRNDSPIKQFYRYDSFEPKLKDADGVDVDWGQYEYLANRDTSVSLEMEPGQELKVRVLYQAPKDLAVKTFSITKEECRTYDFDVSAAQ